MAGYRVNFTFTFIWRKIHGIITQIIFVDK